MTNKFITREDYMTDSGVLHQKYFLQFVTDETLAFVRNRVGLDKLKQSQDYHFNDVIKHERSRWVWDMAPINLQLARELGEVGMNSIPSPATRTCTAKAAARFLLSAEPV